MPIELDNYLKNTWAVRKQVQDQLKLTILAAGLGRRMDPISTHHLPKPMFPLGGTVPMAEIWVRRAVEAGITNVSMNLCVLQETIRSHFKDGLLFGADINYIEEDRPSGTLGGVCKQALGTEAKQTLAAEIMGSTAAFSGTTVIAPSGDIVTNFGVELLEQMYEIHKRQGAAFTMLLAPIPWKRRKEFGTVILGKSERSRGPLSESGPIIDFIEKDPDSPSNLNNASVYFIEMELLEKLDPFRTAADPNVREPFYDFGKHVFPAMLGKLAYFKLPKDYLLWGIRYDGLWYDVGRKRDYLSINKSVLDNKIHLDLPYQKLPWGYLGSGTVINFAEVTIIPPVIIGNECIIERGAKLGPYAIIGDGWTIEKDVCISNSVLWKRYAYFTEQGEKISVRERKLVDRHEVRQGSVIDECIIVGGTITPGLYDSKADRLFEKTVDVLENGELQLVSIDWVPAGPRL
ncbi:sugar phosphate nucleotidyltransferase [Desulfobacca acetoxidans]